MKLPEIIDLAVIGAGPAGIFACVAARKESSDFKVVLFERNTNLANKMKLTGKGRCNLTNSADLTDFIAHFDENGKFFYQAFNTWSNFDTMSFFEEELAVKLKIERQGRVFPESDDSLELTSKLEKYLKTKKVPSKRKIRIVKVSQNKHIFTLFTDQNEKYLARKVIIATGGMSYPQTGSTGDGYEFAKSFGHTINPLRPALAPLYIEDPKVRRLAGLDLDNIKISLLVDGKKILEQFGDMIFTHQGVSGPIILKISKTVGMLLELGKNINLSLDLKPALEEAILEKRINEEILLNSQKELGTLLKNLLPKALCGFVATSAGISIHKQNQKLTCQDKIALQQTLKNLLIHIDDIAPIKNAIVTSGGIPTSEIDPATMESKLVKNLFFAGEIIASEADTGGFNLQKAMSTGYLAGKTAASQD